MAIRRMRRKKMRSTVRKRRYRRRTTRRGDATEIKYINLIANDQSCKTVKTGSLSTDLYSSQYFLSNILKQIGQGVTFSSRVGNKIYVMSIRVRTLVYSCPSATTYCTGTHLLRHIWHNSRESVNSNIAGFFQNTSYINFNSFVDRKTFTVHHDKTYRVQAFESVTDISSDVYKQVGAIREIDYTIPVNRYVTYRPDGDVKEDYNVYSFSSLVMTPVPVDDRQVCCYQQKLRIYFKDS